jgi:hypothetical protein
MWISVIAAGEFEVGQPVSDLPLQNFRIQPSNLPHAIRAGALFRALHDDSIERAKGTRAVIINDLKIIAQAQEDQIPIILTEDANTLSRLVTRLRSLNQITGNVLLLTEGFTPGRLANPAQDELRLPNSA